MERMNHFFLPEILSETSLEDDRTYILYMFAPSQVKGDA